MEVVNSLWHLCLEFCAKNLETICFRDANKGKYFLLSDTDLPLYICNGLLETFRKLNIPVNDDICHIFADTSRCQLSIVNVQQANITDEGASWLLAHNLVDINFIGCQRLTSSLLNHINSHSKRLRSLFIGHTNIFGTDRDFHWVPQLPELRLLSLQRCNWNKIMQISNFDFEHTMRTMLCPLKQLVYLNISGWPGVGDDIMEALCNITTLQILILADVSITRFEDLPHYFKSLVLLRVLDISQSSDEVIAEYQQPEETMKQLLNCLLNLTSLDISGTNLVCVTHMDCTTAEGGKPEISWLCHRQLEFLGLMNCEVKDDLNINAIKIAGTGNEEQLLTALEVYANKPELFAIALDHLYQLLSKMHTFHIQQFRFTNFIRAIEAVNEGMRQSRYNLSVQISGCACIYYLLKHETLLPASKRATITNIVIAMEHHTNSVMLLRNGAVTLSCFSLPHDMIFMYRRLVSLLLQLVELLKGDEQMIRLFVYLLKTLACQVDVTYKKMVGDLGGMKIMLALIKHRLERHLSGETASSAWSVMWSATDETPINSERFIELGGVQCFLQSFEYFSSEPDLKQTMLGVLANVAEVSQLRQHLVRKDLLQAIRMMMLNRDDNHSDKIEMQYSACSILCHLVADEAVWPSDDRWRPLAQHDIRCAVDSWPMHTRMTIVYRSLKPFLSLLPLHDSHSAQYWAAWGLCNLTKTARRRYCPMLDKEDGLSVAKQLLCDERTTEHVRALLQKLVCRCDHFHYDPDYLTEDETAD